MKIELPLKHRRLARQVAGCHSRDSVPVDVVEGYIPPRERGQSWGWETKGGRPIHSPSSYARKGWSNMVYRSSSRRVEVGIQWILENS